MGRMARVGRFESVWPRILQQGVIRRRAGRCCYWVSNLDIARKEILIWKCLRLLRMLSVGSVGQSLRWLPQLSWHSFSPPSGPPMLKLNEPVRSKLNQCELHYRPRRCAMSVTRRQLETPLSHCRHFRRCGHGGTQLCGWSKRWLASTNVQ